METAHKQLLERIQLGFPLSPRPFRELGEGVGMGEGECLEQVRSWKGQGLIRQFGGIFEGRALGYRNALVALRLPPLLLDRAAEAINSHPGVSHNYAREHAYNLWFTIALPAAQDMEREVNELAGRARAEAVLFLPTLKTFKMRAVFSVGNGHAAPVFPASRPVASGELTAAEKVAVRLLQEELPLVVRPFQALAQGAGMEEAELLALGQSLLARGVMRRYSAHLHHRKLGFTANAMGCWVVPLSRTDEVGRAMAASPAVTHCYLRPSYPHWPYNLFTMVHSPSREQCQRIAASLAERTGVGDYILLFSTREYKKVRVRYLW